MENNISIGSNISRCVLLVIIFCLVIAQPASAHTKLKDSDPAQGEVVDRPLKSIELTFSTDVSATLQKVQVVDPKGVDIAATVTVDGSDVVVSVGAERRGVHEVRWRSVGSDGHAINGSYSFEITKRGVTVAPGKSRNRPADVAQSYPIDLLTGIGTVTRAFFYVSLLILVGGTIFSTFIAPGWRPLYFRRSALILAVSAFSNFCINLALAGEYSIWGVLNPWNFVPYILTPVGRVSVGAMLGGIVLLRLYPRMKEAMRRRDSSVRFRFAMLAIALGILPAFGGHAWVSQIQALRIPADMIHLLAASIWIGGIVQIWHLSNPDLAGHDGVYPAVKRFSDLAFVSVIAIVVTGAVAALLEIGIGFGDLFGTSYGRLVLVKVLLLVMVMPLAKVNQQKHVPELMQKSRRSSVNLRRFVAYEIAILVFVMLVTSILVYETPPRHQRMGHDLHQAR